MQLKRNSFSKQQRHKKQHNSAKNAASKWKDHNIWMTFFTLSFFSFPQFVNSCLLASFREFKRPQKRQLYIGYKTIHAGNTQAVKPKYHFAMFL